MNDNFVIISIYLKKEGFVAEPGSLNMPLPNPYTLVGCSLLVVIALTQYFAMRSENVLLTVHNVELQRQLKES